MATFETKCPLCKQEFQAEEEWLGQVGECPSCGKEIKIQAPQANSNQEQRMIQKEESFKAETLADETKQCPFCSEIIKKKALKCKHCESYLDGRNPDNVIKSEIKAKESIISDCPNCGKGIRIKDATAKRKLECPFCNKEFIFQGNNLNQRQLYSKSPTIGISKQLIVFVSVVVLFSLLAVATFLSLSFSSRCHGDVDAMTFQNSLSSAKQKAFHGGCVSGIEVRRSLAGGVHNFSLSEGIKMAELLGIKELANKSGYPALFMYGFEWGFNGSSTQRNDYNKYY